MVWWCSLFCALACDSAVLFHSLHFQLSVFLCFYISGLFRSILATLLAVNWRATLKIRDVSDLGVKVLGRESLITTNDIGKVAMVIGYKVIPEELLVRLRSCCSI